MKTLELTAFHEAGHVVVARLRGGMYVGADLTERPDEWSMARTSGYGARNIEVCLAGIAAQQVRRGHGDRPFPWKAAGAQGDIEKAIEEAKRTRRRRNVYLSDLVEQAYVRTVQLLRKHWADVSLVAKALLQRGALTDGTVGDLLRGDFKADATGRLRIGVERQLDELRQST